MNDIKEEDFLKAKGLVYQYVSKIDIKIDMSRYLYALIPRQDRKLNEAVAKFYGYFWLQCPICGEEFAGYEWIDDHTIHIKGKTGHGVCYKEDCANKAKMISDY